MRKLTLLITLLLFFAFQAAAQTEISGTVTNAESGDPIPGVSVVVQEDESIGTTTNMDGEYNLTGIPSDAENLEFSFVGMQTEVVPIEGRSTINVEMQPGVQEMEEVIVLGYAQRGKNQITGSASQVGGESLEAMSVESVDRALQGEVAGVDIRTNSGTPGSVQDIRIRGRGSLNASNQPLIVIDGVPVNSGNYNQSGAYTSFSKLATLSNNDIESFTVLKDASATSAYGARGSNGVIVIETKQGKSGEVTFDLQSKYGFSDNAVEGRKFLSGEQRFTLYQEAIDNTFDVPDGMDAWEFAQAIDLIGAGQFEHWIENDRPDISWKDAVRNENAPMVNLNLSASGGTDVSSFYASVGYNRTEPTVKGIDPFERISGLVNYERDLRDNLKFNTKVSISNTVQNPIIEQAAYYSNPHSAPVFMPNIYEPYNEEGEPNIDIPPLVYNSLYLAEHDINYNDMTDITGKMDLEWEIVEDLKFETNLSGNYSVLNTFGFGNRNYGDYEDQNGNSSDELVREFNIVFQNRLNYRFSFDSHNFDVTALQEAQRNNRRELWGYGENFPADDLIYLDNAPTNQETGANFYDWKNMSYLGMVNYNYEGKYVLDLTYRREGSSRFAENNRYGNFLSAGFAWNMTEEDFMAGIGNLSTFRLRGAYGTSGNNAIGLNNYQPLMAFDAKYEQKGAFYPTQIGNTALTWEKNRNFDIGLDFGLFDETVTGSFAYYNKETFDLLQNVPMTRTTGFSSYMANVGAMVNKGFEVELDWQIASSEDFNAKIGGHFSTNDNEVTELAKDPAGDPMVITEYANRTDIGHPAREFYMRKWAGVDPETGEGMWYINDESDETTKNYYEAEKQWTGGSPLPTYSGAVDAYIDYKGVYLEMDVIFSGGNKIRETWTEYYMNSGFYPIAVLQGAEELMDRWQEPGDETDVPKQMVASDVSAEASTRFLYDGDYVRVKGITLGYNLPENISSSIGADAVRIYARASNYFTWVKDDDLKHDPEVRSSGVTTLTTPPTKSIIFGLNLKF
ncbi:MAG: SusC/RagA family TonB-linked outer membrane protein [Bacteroidales bacterium]